jgi:hypothetical protein
MAFVHMFVTIVITTRSLPICDESQTCRYLDRADKIRQFDLATAICTADVDFRALFDSDEQTDSLEMLDEDSDSEADITSISTTSALLKLIDPVSPLSATSRTIDYFHVASNLRHGSDHLIPHSFRTHQSSKNVVFHLTHDPSFKRMTVNEVAAKYALPDSHPALGDYLIRLAGQNQDTFIRTVGGRRYSSQDCTLPFTHLEVWTCVRLPTKSYYAPYDPTPAHTINAYPPSSEWPLGRYDSALINNDHSQEWPQSGLTGMFVIYLVLLYLI